MPPLPRAREVGPSLAGWAGALNAPVLPADVRPDSVAASLPRAGSRGRHYNAARGAAPARVNASNPFSTRIDVGGGHWMLDEVLQERALSEGVVRSLGVVEDEPVGEFWVEEGKAR